MKKKLILFCMTLFITDMFCYEIKGVGKCIKREGISIEECKNIAFSNAKNNILSNYGYSIDYNAQNYNNSNIFLDSIFNKYMSYKNFEYATPAISRDMIVFCYVTLEINEIYFKELLSDLKDETPLLIFDYNKSSEYRARNIFLDFGLGTSLHSISNFDNTNKKGFPFSATFNMNLGIIQNISENSSIVLSAGLISSTLDKKYKNELEDIRIDGSTSFSAKVYWVYKEYCLGLELSSFYYDLYTNNYYVYSPSSVNLDFFSLYIGRYFLDRKLILDASIPAILYQSNTDYDNLLHAIKIRPLFYLSLRYILGT